MRDFKVATILHFIKTLQSKEYLFQTFNNFLTNPSKRTIVLRHDVDAKPLNSLLFARIQYDLGVKGTYYFRIVKQSFNQKIIIEIASWGHEIGYHYETMDTCNGNIDKAWDEFRRNLDLFRSIVPIKTICMHGSPGSRFDNKDIWEKYDYKSLGIIGEPYFDIDFNEVAYLTDTGRRWNGNKVSIRDKVNSAFNFNFRTTYDIIRSIDQLPDKVMLTFHPQRWTDRPLPWLQEIIMQNTKNYIKRAFVMRRTSK